MNQINPFFLRQGNDILHIEICLNRAKPIAGLVELVRHGGNGKVVRPLAKRRSSKRSGRPPR